MRITPAILDAEEDPDSRWVAHFLPLVTQSIDTLSYRQYNYHLMVSHNTQLARWLHKILSHSYVNASYTVPYRTRLSSIRRDSGLLECRRINDDVRKLESALCELVDHKVLLDFAREDRRGPGILGAPAPREHTASGEAEGW